MTSRHFGVKRFKVVRSVPEISRYWSVHTHSVFSNNDALPQVKDVVARAKELGYRGLGLTDHGNMAGSVQLYKECMKAGIKPFPGSEIYVVRDREDKKAKRFHMCVVAFTEQGYRNLIRLSTRSHENFHNKPILDLNDLAMLSEDDGLSGVAVTTGCYFGLVQQTLMESGYEAAKSLVASLASWFDQCYVEVQVHHIDQEPMTEAEIATNLQNIADDLGLKMIATQDSHYTHPEHRRDHETLKRLVSWGDDVDDAVFPGDGFHMADDAWMKDHHGGMYESCMAGLDDLLSRHTLTIPELDEYHYLVPEVVVDPQAEMKARCSERLTQLGLDLPRYRARLEEEYEVIDYTGMAGYLVLVSAVTDQMREMKIFYQARGSAAGSLVCYLMQITSVDPLKWSLLMDRFLSTDRTKPPDVDLDIEDTRREEIIDWMKDRFSVSRIGTWGKYSINAEDGQKGSLIVRLLMTRGKQGKSKDLKDVTSEEMDDLRRLDGMKLYKSYGVHAGGLILTTTQREMDAMVPMMWVASSGQLVSQYDMKDVETLGLVKLDALGLKTMSILRQTIESLGRDPADGLDFIPLTDTKCLTAMGRGKTAGVFQLEGGTSTRGMYSLKPRSVKDVIAAMALYRPATMKSGATDDFVRRKAGEQEVPVRHDIINAATKDTFGVLLYQEQVIAVLKALGLNPDELTKFLKAVKASNGDIGNAAGVIVEMLVDIKERCVAAGMSEVDVAWLEEALEAYAGYGFNRAHATVYGITAYRCAWLADNHPVEFFAALLTSATGNKDKEPAYISAARDRGIRLAKPDVNASGVGYTVAARRNGVKYIARGLSSISGVGPKAAVEIAANQPYASVSDFATKVNPRTVTGVKDLAKTGLIDPDDMVGVVKKLHAAGAFGELEEN